MRKTKIIEGIAPDQIPFDDLFDRMQPIIFKKMASQWPIVAAGKQSTEAAMDYLQRFSRGGPLTAYIAPPEVSGRFFYNAEVNGMNFSTAAVKLQEFFSAVQEQRKAKNPSAYYLGSTDVDTYFPGFLTDNSLPLSHSSFEGNKVLYSLWLGNKTVAATHFDMTHNLACCCVGRRRFTLFPPHQVENLYPGPLEPTPAGQTVSMVDTENPDFDKYPNYRTAQAAGEVADLEPGDVLFYPAMWWHEVRALDAFNVMMNIWWNPAPAFMDTPMNTILHGLLSLRDRPQAEKDAWRALFDYYVFGDPENAASHIPENARGPLASLTDLDARRLRAMLIHRLNR